ncbi:MAG: hypothetical protein HRF45_01100 [Fimbriimonadia bacterium]|jgi:hypothetical protein
MSVSAARLLVPAGILAASLGLVFAISQQDASKTDSGKSGVQIAKTVKAVVQAPAALDRKLGTTLSLDNADLKTAIEILTGLDACRDLDIVVADPGEAGRRVTLRIGPEKTVREALEILASAYNRQFAVEKGVVHLKRRGLLIQTPQAGTLFDLAPKFRTDDSGRVQFDLPKSDSIAEALRETAKALRESAKERDGDGGDWAKLGDELRKSAEQLEKLAKELERRGDVPGFEFKEAPRLFTPDRVREFEWRKDLTPEKRKQMEEWLRERGYLDRELKLEIPRIRERVGEVPALKELFKDMPDLREMLKDVPSFRDSFEFRGGDVRQLMDSITPKQWALHEKQGYLKLSDLTPKQRNMVGIRGGPGSQITMSFMLDGKKLTIKSD